LQKRGDDATMKVDTSVQFWVKLSAQLLRVRSHESLLLHSSITPTAGTSESLKMAGCFSAIICPLIRRLGIRVPSCECQIRVLHIFFSDLFCHGLLQIHLDLCLPVASRFSFPSIFSLTDRASPCTTQNSVFLTHSDSYDIISLELR
jgi:hypothetical protein